MTLFTIPRAALHARPAVFLFTSIAALALLGFNARQAQAAIHYVTTTGTGNGSSWSMAGPLQATITHAVSGDQVWVKKGIYTGSFTATDGVAVYGGFAGTEMSVSRRNIAANPTILDGNSSGTVYTVPSSAAGTNTLDGFIIQHGMAQSNAVGGGLTDISNDILLLSNCTFTNNTAVNGGGAWIRNAVSTVTACAFTDNAAIDTVTGLISGMGGGVLIQGGYLLVFSFVDCTFTGNGAGVGGGIYTTGYSGDITGSTFTGNSAHLGGGVWNEGSLMITGSTFTDNGAPYNPNVIVYGGTQGGGVDSSGGVAMITDCIFRDDMPQAIYVGSNSLNNSGEPTTQSVIKDNLVTGTVGDSSDYVGILIVDEYYPNPAVATVANNTIVNAGVGIEVSLISSGSSVSLANNILYGNYGGIEAFIQPGNNTGIAFTLSHNDAYGNTSYNYNSPVSSPTDLSVDPLFIGAPGGDFRLAPNSSLIDAGDDSYVSSGDTDLAGNRRIYGSAVDLGCYEVTNAPVSIWTAAVIGAGPNGAGRIVWNRSDGASGLWVLGANDAETTIGPAYGPYPGWMSAAIATASDGTSRVLRTDASGDAAVWAFNAAGTETAIGPTYHDPSGMTARSIGVAGDGTSRVLWTNTNGMAAVWTFDAGGSATAIGPAYGPYPGWTATGLAAEADGTSRVLWTNTDGRAGLWSFAANDVMSIVGPAYGPYAGWTARAISAPGNGTSRVLWTNTNGAAGIWSFGSSDTESAVGAAYGPYVGWTASALGTASDGTSRVLWNRPDHAAGAWTFDASEAKSMIGPAYGPF